VADESAAKADAIAKRFKEQKPAPGIEATLRRTIDELQRGQPDYAQMSPAFAEVTRQQLSSLKETILRLGALNSVTFKGVGTGGRDIYEVKFEKGLNGMADRFDARWQD
jgi:hypothetical protein